MLSAEIEIAHWQLDFDRLADPDLVDIFVLSLCDNFGIKYPHFKLQLLVSELISNAIDHGVLSLNSNMKNSSAGYERYLIERALRLKELTVGSIVLTAEWVAKNQLRISIKDSGSGFDFSAIGCDLDHSANVYSTSVCSTRDYSTWDHSASGPLPSGLLARDQSSVDGVPKLHGRGLAIINSLCGSVTHLGNGNCTVVEFDVTAN